MYVRCRTLIAFPVALSGAKLFQTKQFCEFPIFEPAEATYFIFSAQIEIGECSLHITDWSSQGHNDPLVSINKW